MKNKLILLCSALLLVASIATWAIGIPPTIQFWTKNPTTNTLTPANGESVAIGTTSGQTFYVTGGMPQSPVLQSSNSLSDTDTGTNHLVADGTFATSAGWTVPAGWTIADGAASHAGTYKASLVGQTDTLSSYLYRLDIHLSGATVGGVTVYLGNTLNNQRMAYFAAATGVTPTYLNGLAGTVGININPSSDWIGNIDDVALYAVTPTNPIASFAASDGVVHPQEIRIGPDYTGNVAFGWRSESYVAKVYDVGLSGNNNSIGSDSLPFLMTGQYNNSMGQESLHSCVSCFGNTAMGDSALRGVINNHNTGIGYEAGRGIWTGQYNSYFGSAAGYGLNTSGQSGQSHPLSTGDFNTGLGYSTLYRNITGSNATAVGARSQTSSTSGNNTSIGAYSLFSLTSGTLCTAIGYQAGYTISTGTALTAVGDNALFKATGASNTAIGQGAGYNIGGGARNFAGGAQSLYFTSTTNDNVAIGHWALQGSNGSNMSETTALGSYAGVYQTDGSTALASATDSIFVGYKSRGSANALTNEIVVGANAVGLGSNTANIGSSGVSKFGIGGGITVSWGNGAPGAGLTTEPVGSLYANRENGALYRCTSAGTWTTP